MQSVKLGRVETVLEDLPYPISRSDAGNRLAGTTLLFADGEADLGGLVAEMGVERFESAGDLEAELHTVLPREAVGEPYQSEGEG
ncbi:MULTISPECIES: hypothetical protein [Saliphagus]|uniref:Uncharacterized protein n=1 Tax=Saliphagus infecundisoli TaxID=1849069 RepID=A0ABD5QJH0_9EURY|nr:MULTISPECIES: hypothetical protein [Saliphagus]